MVIIILVLNGSGHNLEVSLILNNLNLWDQFGWLSFK